MAEEEIGSIGEYFARIGVAGLRLTATLKRGDTVHIKGHTTDLQFTADTIEIDRVPVEQGNPGDHVGMRVPDRVREGDRVYRVTA